MSFSLGGGLTYKYNKNTKNTLLSAATSASSTVLKWQVCGPAITPTQSVMNAPAVSGVVPAACYSLTPLQLIPHRLPGPACLSLSLSRGVQWPRGSFQSSPWRQAGAGCCPFGSYGGSYSQQICLHTLTHIHHLGAHEHITPPLPC